MINKISDVSVRGLSLEETTDAKEPQPQDNIHSEVEPLVQATMLLRNQLNESMKAADPQDGVREPVSFTRDSAPSPVGKSASEVIKDTLQHIPEELNNQLGEMKKAWSDPGQVVSDAVNEAGRIWSDIKSGK